MLAFLLAQLLAATGPASAAACPNVDPRIVIPALFVPPDGTHPTNRYVRFELDLGSDGRIRRVAMTESSGDPTFDADALAAAKAIRFAPPEQGCISTSFVAPQTFEVPLIDLARPPTSAGGLPSVPTNAPAAAVQICSDPFVQLSGLGLPDEREPAGTVGVDVGLDARAHVTSVHLARTSGNPKLDAVAVAAAHDGEYEFVAQPGCPPKPTIYDLELTFH
jgi:TonB family protein